jgi:hypothetical protein
VSQIKKRATTPMPARSCEHAFTRCDAVELWPGWEASNRVAIHWTVSDYAHEDGRLLCEYAGRSEVNRELIGNGGVCEFDLT